MSVRFRSVEMLVFEERGEPEYPEKKPLGARERTQGHPMDLFLKISVLQANFCWLGDVEEIIVPGRKVLLGKR